MVLLGLGFFLEPETIRPNPVIPINAVAVSEAAFNAETQKQERKEKLKKEKLKKEKLKKEKLKKEKLKKEKLKKEKARKEKERKAREEQEAEEARARDKAEAGSALTALVSQIVNKVRANWTEPPRTNAGLKVVISVKVKLTGEVETVKLVKSSGDAVFDRSAENAVYRASPLPFPKEPRYFNYIKNFNFVFSPQR